ncbi:hypothetical protein [Candidatus Magnetominusculus xianensis]|uniref:Transposase n=1 Tax=Candidatus Magnetominusculus xianensis TaxID=1748249 RepID=A0ABR5SFW3_9BACT|nr:hypothetical protein [Candidatus Magnetominusculus xianensis]KWT84197.1 hypothetical protein ASN18_1950 [Candidatus Magnetominusculus xianensis]MBF0405428.1 hypothetical protein [Nitrospirota bacterium]
MSTNSNPLNEAALSRYNEIDGIINEKREEIEALMNEHTALKAYLISMDLLKEDVPVKKRGRKPKDKSAMGTVEKKKPGRKKKVKEGE